MLKIQFKHSKSVNGGARQVKGDSSVKRDFRSPSRPVNKTTIPPFLGRSKRSTQRTPSRGKTNRWWMIFQGLLMSDLSTFHRIVMKSSSDVFVPDGGTVPHLFLWFLRWKIARSRILTKHQIVVIFWSPFWECIDVTHHIQGEWNEDRYQKRHLDVFREEA